MKKVLSILVVLAMAIQPLPYLCGCNLDNSAYPHKYSLTVVDPTCISPGYTLHQCTTCSKNFIDNEILPLGHTPANPMEENRIEPTCTENGSYDSVVYCSVCDAEISRDSITIPTEGHNYETEITEPTCMARGYTTYTCTKCGDSYIGDYVNAIEHNFGEWVVTKAATCIETGIETRYCSYDSTHTETRPIDKIDHCYRYQVVIEPTCTSPGQGVYICENCRDNYPEEIAKLDHSYTPDYTTIEYIDNQTIRFMARCEDCGDEKSMVAEFSETIEPTCIDKGHDEYLSETGIKCVLNETEPTHLHLVGYIDGEPLILKPYRDSTDEGYIIDESIQYFIDEGIIRFNNGINPTKPGERRLAIFDCQHCGRMIVCLLKLGE